MPYVAYTRSFGAAYANQQVQVKDSATGGPVRILATASGGHISELGLTELDGSGNLSVFVDSAITPTSNLTTPTLSGPSLGGAGVTDGDKGDIVVSDSGATWGLDPSIITSAGRAVISAANAAAQRTALGLGTSATQDAVTPTALSADRTITALDDGAQFYCTTALTITIPAALSPRPSCIVDCPPSGNVTVAVTGGALLNGGTTSLTRSRANNPAGVAILAHQDADSYGMSGI